MFGISLVELLIALLVAIFLVKPADMPQIAHYLGKIYSKFKKVVKSFKDSLEDIKKEAGFDQIKQEFDLAVDEQDREGVKKSKKTTQIVDIYGETHHVLDVSGIRPDLTEQDIEKEIEALNSENKNKVNQD